MEIVDSMWRRRGRIWALVLSGLCVGVCAWAFVIGSGGAVLAQGAEEQPEAGTAPRVGDDVILVYRGGARIEAMLVGVTEEQVVLDVAGVEVRVDRGDVVDLIRLPPVEERFRQRRAMLDEDAVEARLNLAQWGMERGLYAEALREVEGVLEVQPREGRAIRMLNELRALIELRAQQARRDAARAARGDPPEEEKRSEPDVPVRVQRRIVDFPLLSEEQINLIKVYEVDLRNPPRIRIERETVEELLRRYAGHAILPTTAAGRRAFLDKDPVEILDVMFRLRARELYPEVEVVGNPESMERFRKWVNAGWLVSACATPRCHGGAEAGRLILYNRDRASDVSAYTNFLILDRYRTETGEELIDYEEPSRSLLLEMGLLREESVLPHPDVEGWRPVFPSRRAINFERAVEWIESMFEPRPAYPIEYEPPTPKTVETEPVGGDRTNR